MDQTDKKSTVSGKKQTRGLLLLFLLLAVTVFLFLRDYSLKELYTVIRSADCRFLLAGFLMMLLFTGCEAVNIQMILRSCRCSVSLTRCMEYSMIGYYFSCVTPSSSGGQPMQIYYMGRDSIPVSLSSAVIFYIVLIYQAAMLLSG